MSPSSEWPSPSVRMTPRIGLSPSSAHQCCRPSARPRSATKRQHNTAAAQHSSQQGAQCGFRSLCYLSQSGECTVRNYFIATPCCCGKQPAWWASSIATFDALSRCESGVRINQHLCACCEWDGSNERERAGLAAHRSSSRPQPSALFSRMHACRREDLPSLSRSLLSN